MQLRVAAPETGRIDGVWWPRSPVLTEELATLCAELYPRVGPVALVVYDAECWSPDPSGTAADDGDLRLEGSRALAPDTLIVVGVDGRRLVVRVVAPDTGAVEAEQAMSEAATLDAVPHDEAGRAAAVALSDVTMKLAGLDGPLDDARIAQITRWVSDAARHFEHAPVQAFVPILVEHIVRDRLATARTGT